MRFWLIICVLVALFFGSVACPQSKTPHIRQVNPPDTSPQYFPRGVFDTNADLSEWIARWCAKDLRALEEPSLFEHTKETTRVTYRLLLIPSFQRTLAIRLEIQANGTGLVTAKMSTEVGNEPGHILRSESASVSTEQVEEFLKLEERMGFWSLPTQKKVFGADGTEWILEGRKVGKYHVVDRWAGSLESSYSHACDYLIELSPVKPEPPRHRRREE